MTPLPPHDPSRVFLLTPEATGLSIPGIGHLQFRKVQGQGVRLAALTGASLTVRFRRGGERFQPAGRRYSQELKKLLQEAGIPPWERDRRPLLYVNEVLAAVAGLGVGVEFLAPAGEDGLAVESQSIYPSNS
jgi:tRNA(Ile)-lysidine synthase